MNTKKIWKNIYKCRCCNWKSFSYSSVRIHIMLYHPEIYYKYKQYVCFYRRVRYDEYLNRKAIAKTIAKIKGKVKMPLRLYL